MTVEISKNGYEDRIKKNTEYKPVYVWESIIVLGIFHVIAVYGLWLTFTLQVNWRTILFSYTHMILAIVGLTAGSHRLWSHKSYKAKLPLRIWLAVTQASSFQKNIYEWVRDHRVHHKFTDTNADPHNATRGLFFSHLGWLLVRKHPDVIAKGKIIDLSDIEQDPVVMYQKKFYLPVMIFLCFILPVYVPVKFWGESLATAYIINIMRFTIGVHITVSINSIAHRYGNKPYDGAIEPAENLLCSMVSLGEGWHNYHHAFPWDYKTAELGFNGINLTTGFLNFMAYIGQAYDLKSASEELIRLKATRRGDGTWTDPKDPNNKNVTSTINNYHIDDHLWGWGDTDMEAADVKAATIDYRKNVKYL